MTVKSFICIKFLGNISFAKDYKVLIKTIR